MPGTSSKWKHFTREELACRCGCGDGENKMDDTFMRTIVMLREKAGFPFPVSSGYRCPRHNQHVSTTGLNGPHTTGRAIDIKVSRKQANYLLRIAIQISAITGLGFKQHGPTRFMHLDDLPDAEGRPRPTIWSYR